MRKIIDLKDMDKKTLFSTLWLFATLNYIYCDVVGLMDSNLLNQFLSGTVEGIELSQNFLLGASLLVEIPIAMVILSRVLSYPLNRWSNIIAGTIMTLVQISTLFLGTPTIYYMFFSAVEIATTASIVWLAWKWTK